MESIYSGPCTLHGRLNCTECLDFDLYEFDLPDADPIEIARCFDPMQGPK